MLRFVLMSPLSRDVAVPRTRSVFVRLLVIVILAIAFRLLCVWVLRWRTDSPNSRLGSEAIFIADSVVAGKGFSSPFGNDTGPTAWMTPVYPYLLAGIFKIAGTNTRASILTALVLNELLSALTCVPIYFAAKRIGGEKLALAASLLWAVYPIAALVSSDAIWYSSLSTLLMACGLWATLAISDSERPRDWIGYGLLWAANLMTNAAVASLVPFVFAWLIWERAKRKQRAFRLPVMATLVIGLACLPWVIRNYEVFGTFVPLRTNLGATLWAYNGPERGYPLWSLSERASMVQMGEIAYNQDRGQRAAAVMLHGARIAPWRAVEVLGERFSGMWLGIYHPVGDLGVEWLREATNLGLCFLGFAGLVLLYRRSSGYIWLFAVFPLVFPAMYYLTIASNIYRHPIDPVLVILAAYALVSLDGRGLVAQAQ